MNFKHLYYFWKVAGAGGVTRASRELHITPHTISGQIKRLEESLGARLFVRDGREMRLTEQGRLAVAFAEDMFSLGAELEQSLRTPAVPQRLDFRVGVSGAMPKALACRLLEPLLGLDSPVRLVCREWQLDALIVELTAHRLDLVLADNRMARRVGSRIEARRLITSGTSFLASPRLLQCWDAPFPACLHGAPLMLPGDDVGVRGQLLEWLESHRVRPEFVADFDDGALMYAFGEGGAGVVVAPSILEGDLVRQFGLCTLGRAEEVRSEFFVLYSRRRMQHPCVTAIASGLALHTREAKTAKP